MSSKTATGDAGERVWARAKVLSHPRLRPTRTEGRAAAATLLRRVIREEDAKVAQIARALGCSETLVWSWLDPNAKQQFAVGDLLALRVGSEAVAWGYADEICRYLARAAGPGRTPLEHVTVLAQAVGEAATALTRGGDRDERVSALRTLKLRVAQALADEGD